jgi:hypothetical protein
MIKEETGWLQSYLNYRQQFKMLAELKKDQNINPEASIYQALQPTGLMYGQPLTLPENIQTQLQNWNNKEKARIILVESFINCALLSQQEQINNKGDIADIIINSTSGIIEYYNHIYPELQEKSRLFFFKKKPPTKLEIAEFILSKRIDLQSGMINHFWGGFFHNSLLFLDVFFYGKWKNANNDNPSLELIKKEQEEIRFVILKIIAASAYADLDVGTEESTLFDYFIDSANFSAEKRKEAEKILHSELQVEEIEIPQISSWVLRKFLLELAILTIWVDKIVSDREKTFLKTLNTKLNFSEDELENSMLAIESFVLEHWEEIHYLQNKENYHIIRDRFLERLSSMADKNKSQIQQGIGENKTLMELLTKSQKGPLSEKENEQLRNGIIQILKFIPTFYIISLPGTVLTTPILLKILPKDAFPNEIIC